MMQPLVLATGATLVTPSGRPLFAGLTLRLEREHVALIGRNGVGKSSLLAALAGTEEIEAGRLRTRGRVRFVPQHVVGGDPRARAKSHGELRRRALAEALAAEPDVLLLDEPTEDLDDEAVGWLRRELRAFGGCLVVASHDRRLLADFRDFFVASETGCRAFQGMVEALEADLEREHRDHERRYVRGLLRLAEEEAHTLHVARRKARKKRYGRCSELDRGTPRIRLNQKRSEAQVSHGRLAKLREEKLAAAREWSKASRRALSVNLALDVPVPELGPDRGEDALVLRGVSARAGERQLFGPLDLAVNRERVALVGPNGAGKTTLLEIALGLHRPEEGRASRDRTRVGSIEQGGANWMLDESLVALLGGEAGREAPDEVAALLVAHRLPLALAHRPLRSLSPGERARAALLCLFARAPAIDVLVLDEPTFSLDLLAQRAMAKALRAWPGGLLVASHDRAFLEAIGIDATVDLGATRVEDPL